MSQQGSDLNSLMAVLGNLESQYPGSVVIDETTGSVTLIGWHQEQFNDPESDKNATDNIKRDSCGLRRSRVSGDLTARTENAGNQDLLVGMVNPFSDTPQGATEGNKPCRCSRICGQDSGSVNQKHKESACNKYFVPVVKRKFGDRVFHVLSRLMFWRG